MKIHQTINSSTIGFNCLPFAGKIIGSVDGYCLYVWYKTNRKFQMEKVLYDNSIKKQTSVAASFYSIWIECILFKIRQCWKIFGTNTGLTQHTKNVFILKHIKTYIHITVKRQTQKWNKKKVHGIFMCNNFGIELLLKNEKLGLFNAFIRCRRDAVL